MYDQCCPGQRDLSDAASLSHREDHLGWHVVMLDGNKNPYQGEQQSIPDQFRDRPRYGG